MSRKTVLAVFGALLSGGWVGYSCGSHEEHPQSSAADELTPVKLLELAVTIESSDPSRADVLAQAAVDRLAKEPSSLEEFWTGFEKYLSTRQSLAPEELLARLLIIDNAVEAATVACRTKAQLELAWRVHERVEQAIQSAQDEVVGGVAREAQEFTGAIKSTSNDWLVRFTTLRPNWERRLSGAVALPATSGQKESLRGLANTAGLWQREILETIKSFEVELDRALKATSMTEARPAESGGGDGTLQRKLDQLDSFAQAVAMADLEAWQRFLANASGNSADAEHEMHADDSAVVQIANVATRFAALQQLRYNLWALSQLTTAETSDAWDNYIGRVDVGLLKPATAALYSMVYDKRVREVSDPKSQADSVQRILKHEKEKLQSF